jgi:hypothetical protein
MRVLTRSVLAALFAAITAPAMAAVELSVVNNTEVCLELSFFNQDRGVWFRPLLRLNPGESSPVHFTGSRYFWTAAARGPDPTPVELGWIDPREIKNRSESAALAIEGQFVTEQRQETYMVTKPVYETVEQAYTVIVRRLVDGKWRLVPEVRIRAVQIMKMVPEQRVRTVNVERLALNAVARADGEPLVSEVTFRTLIDGAFVRYRLAGRARVYTAPNPTTSTKELPIGIYVIWTERDGHPTSRKNSYDLFEKKLQITIPETQP